MCLIKFFSIFLAQLKKSYYFCVAKHKTEKSLNAAYCKKELNYARINDKKIRAVLLDAIVPRKGWFALEYGDINCVNYTDKSQVDKLMQELADAYQPEATEARRQEKK